MSERAFVICFCLFAIWFLFIREDWRTAQCKKNKEKYGKWMTDSEYKWYLKEKRFKKIVPAFNGLLLFSKNEKLRHLFFEDGMK